MFRRVRDHEKQDKQEPAEQSHSAVSPDGSYRFVRPESKEMLYRDAGVESAEDAAKLPRYYCYSQKKTEKCEDEDSRSGFFVRVAGMCLVCALLGGIAGGAIAAGLITHREQGEETAQESPTLQQGTTARNDVQFQGAATTHQPTAAGLNPGAAMTASEIYDLACEQVVGITTEVNYKNFFGQTTSSAVSGSGFIISPDGYIMTNYHVIEYADTYGYAVKVMLHDGSTYTATIAGTEPDNDLAVLQIQATGLNAVTLGNSDNIHVGDSVQAVGNPLGELDFTMTFGRITALNRSIKTSETNASVNMFQIDAAVNKGNSGGPVYNDRGEVIGVVTAKYSSAGIEGLGFAIPINDAVSIANELISNGHTNSRAYLGVSVKTMSSNAALYYNSTEGAYVYSVEENSPAQAAGIKAGDVIFQIDDTQTPTEDDLRAALQNYHAGVQVVLHVFRSGEELVLPVTLGEWKAAASDDSGEGLLASLNAVTPHSAA